MSYVPFIKKITARELGESMLLHAIELLTNQEFPRGENNILTLNNNQIRLGRENLQAKYNAAGPIENNDRD